MLSYLYPVRRHMVNSLFCQYTKNLLLKGVNLSELIRGLVERKPKTESDLSESEGHSTVVEQSTRNSKFKGSNPVENV